MVVLAGCAAPGLDAIRRDIATFPADQQSAFTLLEERCTRCHTIGSVFAAHVPSGGWERIVRRMTRKPGAGIPEGEASRIAAFMDYFRARRDN